MDILSRSMVGMECFGLARKLMMRSLNVQWIKWTYWKISQFIESLLWMGLKGGCNQWSCCGVNSVDIVEEVGVVYMWSKKENPDTSSEDQSGTSILFVVCSSIQGKKSITVAHRKHHNSQWCDCERHYGNMLKTIKKIMFK